MISPIPYHLVDTDTALKRLKGSMEKATHKNEPIEAKMSMELQRVATSLQTPSVGTKMMNSQEHAWIMRAISTFYTSAVETLRRELVSYGAVISNMANKQRIEISIIAKHSLHPGLPCLRQEDGSISSFFLLS